MTLSLANKFEIAVFGNRIFDLINEKYNKAIHNFSNYGQLNQTFKNYFFDGEETFTLHDKLASVLEDYVPQLNCDLKEAIQDEDVIDDLFYLLQDQFLND